MRRLLLLPLLTLPALAQSALSPLKDHPLLKQAEAYLLAARKSLEAQAAPLALNVQGNYLRYGYTCEPEAVCASLPEAAQSLTLALVLTPFPFGEVADGVERAQIALRRAELAYRKTRAGLEAQAVAAYGRYQEARLGVRIAEKRQAKPKELREAELALEVAQNRLEEARRGLALALEAARDLVDPEAPLPPIPEPKGTTPLSLEEARLNLLEAQIALEAAQRNLLPTLQGSYTRYPSGNDTLSLSLSSKTLQPTLAYTRQNPAQAATALPGGGRYRATEELRLSLSLTLSPGLFAALEAAQAQVRGAEEAFLAASRQARLQEESLKAGLLGARSALALAQSRKASAEKALEEAEKRLALGLESPLGVLQAELNLLQAELGLLQAENDLRNRLMELYQFYGELLEVNP